MEKKHLSWEQFDELVQKLAGAIGASGFEPDVLLGITRGGLVPLAILGEQMGKKNVATISARSYDGVEQGELRVTALPDIDLRGKKVLLVDEITDTGETFRRIAQLVRERYEPAELKTAVVVVNTAHCSHMPDYSVMQTQEWVVFPWQVWPRRRSDE